MQHLLEQKPPTPALFAFPLGQAVSLPLPPTSTFMVQELLWVGAFQQQDLPLGLHWLQAEQMFSEF